MADSPQLAGLISADKLSAFCYLSDRRLRQLAKDGFFPPPVESMYQFLPTMQGLLRYYREHNARTKEGAQDSREEKTQVQTRLLLLEEKQKLRKMIERSEVNKLLLHVASQMKAVLFAALEREYPGKVVGRTASEISLAGRQLGDRLCSILTREVEQWQKQD